MLEVADAFSLHAGLSLHLHVGSSFQNAALNFLRKIQNGIFNVDRFTHKEAPFVSPKTPFMLSERYNTLGLVEAGCDEAGNGRCGLTNRLILLVQIVAQGIAAQCHHNALGHDTAAFPEENS